MTSRAVDRSVPTLRFRGVRAPLPRTRTYWSSGAQPGVSSGDEGASQVPGETPISLCRALRSRSSSSPHGPRGAECCRRWHPLRRPRQHRLSRLNDTASRLAVYASRFLLPGRPRKTRFRLVANLCRAGVGPAGFQLEGFEFVDFAVYIPSSFSRLGLAHGCRRSQCGGGLFRVVPRRAGLLAESGARLHSSMSELLVPEGPTT